MKSLFHHSSIIIFSFSLSLLMISIINIPKCLGDDDIQHTNCNIPFYCNSNITNLKYPFWGENRPSYCGGVDASNMSLTCEERVPKITINSIKYRILEWDNTTQRLRVARDDYWDLLCFLKLNNDNYKNSTFEKTQFQRYGYSVANVTLLYHCSVATGKLRNPYHYIYCGDAAVHLLYTSVYSASYSASCAPTHTVVIPISETQAAKLGFANGTLQNAIHGGFDLKWIGNNRECESCVDSGGECGNDGIQFRCFCKNGPGKATCNYSSMAPSNSSSKRNGNQNRKKKYIVIGASVVGFGITVFIIIMICCQQQQPNFIPINIFRKGKEVVDHKVEVFMKSYNLSIPRRYSYTELKRITNSFKDKLGQGGYSDVYKASLSDGRQVAVKVIKELKGSGEEFINEVASIGRTSHMNIVSLLGFCYEVNKRALIYEFMPKGSLDKFIYKSEFPNAICDFDWNTLFQIAIGIAKGLEYLHQGCNSRILHLDIKPQNILLDENFCPKISDFGLAKVCQKKDSIVSIPGARGTIGYMAPEIFSRAFGGVSHKSDVYSYGMLILEMIGGRKNYDTGGSCSSEMYFPDWIYKDLEKDNTNNNCSMISEEENDTVRKITLVSLWCIQTNPSDRPPMNDVIEMLQGPLSSIPYPPKPVLFSSERPPLEEECTSSSDMYETNSIIVSK